MKRALSVLAALLLGTQMGARAEAPALTPATLPAPAAARYTLPTFGLALADPPGFGRMAEGAPNRVAQWMRLSAGGKMDLTSLIYIEVEPVGGRTLKDFAGFTAMINGAALQATALTIDSAPALRVATRSAYKPFATQKLIVTQHENQFYTLGIMETPGDNCDPASAALCASIRWQKIERVADHLEPADFRAAPVRVFGRMEINFPAAMRRGGGQDLPTRDHWSLLNLTTNQNDLIIDLQLAAFDRRNNFEDVRLGYGETLKKRFNLNRDIVWKSAPNAGGLDVWVTQPTETAALGSDNKEHITPVRWALVNLRTHVVVIVFNLGSRSVEEAKPYSAAVDRIVATIKPVETR